MVASIWGSLIPTVDERTLGPDDSFFDIGGHSILAQQMLFKIKKSTGVNITMSAIFRSPTLKGFASEIEKLERSGTNGTIEEVEKAIDYAADAKTLERTLPTTFKSATNNISPSDSITVFLTGGTGFLGAYLLRDLLSRKAPSIRVVTHVRAIDEVAALERIKQTCKAYGVWNPKWVSRITCVTGSL